ncbi:uncharacterized protein LOC131163550 [Malania oleifera]|uniref:uncharacterized protein LOC131163550 n=1 Tax=Malania oleifera TaxID=397392 RepID=UPI0025AE27E8|nr:uncharacterized protein LOC131163550 [Malania oleifera]
MQIFPESVRKRWNYWELRLLVLLSLFLQIILIIFGNWRKYSARNWIKVVLWLAYLSADWVATVSLGILCNNQGDSDSLSPDNVMMAFWAPFLLVHLGGPDTITAYSLEDNELWLRHLLGLVVQVGVAFYIFLRSWTTRSYHLMLLAIPMFIAGIVKYGERTWVLRSASYDHFEESLLPRHSQSHLKIKRHKLPPPRPKSPKHTEVEVVTDSSMEDEVIRNSSNSETKIYQDAFFFFKNFKRLYADLIFSEYEIQESRDFFINQSLEEAFKVIKLELGFMLLDH